jgi:hypothetical protein
MILRFDTIYNLKLISRANRFFIMAYSIVASTAECNTTNLFAEKKGS